MLAIVFVLAAVFAASEATVCTVDADCGSNQCCYIKPEFMVVSKRQLLLPVQPVHSKTGVCENYRSMGDHCGPLETLNGHCGCASGMSCQWVPDATTPSVVRRKLPGHNEPGAYRCATKA